MKNKTGVVKEAHAEFDRRWSKLLRENHACVSCVKGCSACCSEPVMVNEAEARLIVSSIPAAKLPAVKERTRVWLQKVSAAGLLPNPEPHVLDWLAAEAVCPLLENGLCLVYEHRPLGCRYHTARDNPQLCFSRETRLEQRYAINKELPTLIGCMLMAASNRFGNLGVYLARWLLNVRVESGTEFALPLATITQTGSTLKVVLGDKPKIAA